jgi:4-amino-4-deoxy-L-arabinose transferase-like glycosyltransferase
VFLRAGVVCFKPIPVGDENSFIEIADTLAEGRGYAQRHKPTYYPPLYPMLVTGLRIATGDAFLATRLLFVLLGPLLVLAVFRLATRIYSERIALLAAFLAAVFPSLVGTAAYWGQSETLYLALATLGIASWLRGARGEGPGNHLTAGIWLGLALLTRTEALVLVLALLAAGLVRIRSWPRVAALVLLPFLAAVGIRCLVNLEAAGRFTPDLRLGGFLRRGIRSDTGAVKEAIESGTLAEKTLAGKPVARRGFLAKLGTNARDLARDFVLVFPPFLLVPLSLGIFARSLSRRRRHGHLLVLAAAAATAGFVLVAFVKASYVALLVPLLLPWTTVGLLRVDRWVKGTWPTLPRRVASGACFLLLLALVPVQPLRLVAGGRLPVEYYRAEIWIRENGPADVLVLCDSPNCGANTRRDFRAVRTWDLARVEEFAQRAGRPVLLVAGERARKYAVRLVEDVRRAVGEARLDVAASFQDAGMRVWIVRLGGS